MPGLMAFHAHPDDEVTSTGGVLARYAAAGEHVVVVTATDGAEGEIHNYENPEELKAKLPEMRANEVAAALDALGVDDHAFLGYRDSGMMGTEPNAHPDCFWQADYMEATGRLIEQIRIHRPEVMIIYDPFGGYGHPDHIQVHRIGIAAFWAAADVARFPDDDGPAAWKPQKLYWSAWPRARVEIFAKRRFERGDVDEEGYERMRRGGVPEDELSAIIDVEDFIDHKIKAWESHRTQIPSDWWIYNVDDDDRATVLGRETFQRVFSSVDVPRVETDLFSGLR